jgi:hypothetical protein
MIYRPFKENHYTALLEGTNSNICLCCLHARKLVLFIVDSISSSYNTKVWEVSVTYCYGYMCSTYATKIPVIYSLLHWLAPVIVTKLNRPTKRKYNDNQLSKGKTTAKLKKFVCIKNTSHNIKYSN